MPRLFSFPCSLIRVLDGDTVEVEADLGFHIRRAVTVRLEYVNTPEITGKEKEAGLLVRDVVVRWFKDRKSLLLHSHQLDKYGRVLGEIVDTDSLNLRLSEWLLSGGLSLPYSGQGRASFTPAQLEQVIRCAKSLL